MSMDGNDDAAPDGGWSGLDLMGVVRRLAGGAQPQPQSALSPLLALFAGRPAAAARMGLFGGQMDQRMQQMGFDGVRQPAGPAAPTTVSDDQIQPAQSPAPSDLDTATPATGVRTTSPQGRAFIRQPELDPKTKAPYLAITPDGYGNPTVGVGHKVAPGEAQAIAAQLGRLDQNGRLAYANALFDKDLAAAEQQVRDKLGPEALATLSQPQFDALVADAFNAGRAHPALGPVMQQHIWDGDLAAAGQEFNAVGATDAKTKAWSVAPGLVRRSLQEAAIFNRGDYHYQPSAKELADLARSATAAHDAKGGKGR